MLNCIVWNRTVYLYKSDLVSNNLQRLICHKTRPSNSYPYKHKPQPTSRTRSFLSKMVFFFSSLCASRPLYLLTNQWDIFWGTFPCQYWRLFLSKSICSTYCQCTNPRNHQRPKNLEKSPTSWPPPKNSLPSNKRNRLHLSLDFVGTRKMQAPKHHLAQFLWDTS